MKDIGFALGVIALILWEIAEHGLPVPQWRIRQTGLLIAVIIVLSWLFP